MRYTAMCYDGVLVAAFWFTWGIIIVQATNRIFPALTGLLEAFWRPCITHLRLRTRVLRIESVEAALAATTVHANEPSHVLILHLVPSGRCMGFNLNYSLFFWTMEYFSRSHVAHTCELHTLDVRTVMSSPPSRTLTYIDVHVNFYIAQLHGFSPQNNRASTLIAEDRVNWVIRQCVTYVESVGAMESPPDFS